MNKTYLITGGAGFIGSAMVRRLVSDPKNCVINIDKLTYASNRKSLEKVEERENYFFYKNDICDYKELINIFLKHSPDVVMHFAAESHVDRSINEPQSFLTTNIMGTYNLLEICREHFKKKSFIFHHVSTDEVYGDIEENKPSVEHDPYLPSSPYSASKAASDHLVRAWHRTYQLPILITNCSNNYGPYQNYEKLIPKVIINLINNVEIPIYGKGNQIRDWIYVDDHIEGILKVINKGKIGETYNLGGNNEIKNIDLVNQIIEIMININGGTDEDLIQKRKLIKFVTDRPGHDQRYSINSSKAEQIGWIRRGNFADNLKKTVEWFINNYQIKQ
tara:strand:+ start:8195 stop:9193 length:999 start_codon:yes stop_codon:yes gene_type:complete